LPRQEKSGLFLKFFENSFIICLIMLLFGPINVHKNKNFPLICLISSLLCAMIWKFFSNLPDYLASVFYDGHMEENMTKKPLKNPNLKVCLWQLGKSQKWLAAKTGISRSEICKILNGRIRPTGDEQKLIAGVLGVSPALLFAEPPASIVDCFNCKNTQRALPATLRRMLAEHCAEGSEDSQRVCGLIFRDPNCLHNKFLVVSVDQAAILADLATQLDWEAAFAARFHN
jgi:transcriptional regulator with XRE-family HTH domain